MQNGGLWHCVCIAVKTATSDGDKQRDGGDFIRAYVVMVRRAGQMVMIERVTSCGVVLLDNDGRVLLAHATGTSHWDIPKGRGEEGETPIISALRELVEETGFVLAPERLTDLGRFVYRRDKDLHLFAARATRDELDLSRCVCTSLFPRRWDGLMIPEMDAFRWVQPEEVEQYASRSLFRLFQTTLSLAELHQSL
jgi:8-oxo-dGTP pyrophosphatase MutT (NUDIX family)